MNDELEKLKKEHEDLIRRFKIRGATISNIKADLCFLTKEFESCSDICKGIYRRINESLDKK